MPWWGAAGLTYVNSLRTHAPKITKAIVTQDIAMHRKGREFDIGDATAAILISLLQVLAKKDLLTNAEIRAVLMKAANDLGPHEYTEPIKGAVGIILDDILPRFPEDGGD
jgi:hypothetical protein